MISLAYLCLLAYRSLIFLLFIYLFIWLFIYDFVHEVVLLISFASLYSSRGVSEVIHPQNSQNTNRIFGLTV
jgi:hypothetical protein